MMSRWAASLFLAACLSGIARADELPGSWVVHDGDVRFFQSYGGVFLVADFGASRLWVHDRQPAREIVLKPEQAKDFSYVAMDGEGGLWLFSDPLQGTHTWFHPNAEVGWIAFGNQNQRHQPLFDKEAAFLYARHLYGRPFALGAGAETYQLAHGPGQTMAFLNDRNRLCFFDGRSWDSPITGHELPDAQAPIAQPFFDPAGTLRLQGEKGSYTLAIADNKRVWTLETASGTRKARPELFRKPETLPYAQWTGRMGPVAWSQSGFELQFSIPGKHRLMILPQEHPFTALRGDVDVAMDVYGGWAFAGRTQNRDVRRVIVHRPDPPFRWRSPLGEVLGIHADSTSLLAQFGFSETQAEHVVVRMRRDNTAWTEITGTPVLDAGNYAVDFEVGCVNPPFFAGPLPSTLSYGLDLGETLNEWIADLGAPRFEDRQAAETRLREAFLIARPLLRLAVAQTQDPEIAYRALRLLNTGEGVRR